MKDKLPKGVELNLRSKALGIAFDKKNLYLTAVHNKLNELQYKGCDILTDFEGRTSDEVQEFIEDFQSRYGIKRADAYMLFPREQVQIQVAEFPLEARENLQEAVEYQLGNYFPTDLESYDFFPQIINRSDQLKVMIVAMEKGLIGHAFGLISRWNLKLAGLSLDTFGLVNGLSRSNPEIVDAERIVIFHAYANGLEMAALNQGRLVCSHYFEWEPVPDEEAFDYERVVSELEHGFGMARMDPNEVDRYIWVGSNHQHLQTYLDEQVGIPFQAWHDKTDAPIDADGLVGFGAAAAAVHDKVPLDFNILPEKLRKRHKRLPVMIATIVLIIGSLFFMVSEGREYGQLRSEMARVEKNHAEIMTMLTEVSTARTNFENRKTELEMFKRYRTNSLLLKLMFQISQDFPANTYLTNFQVKNGNQLTLQGESNDPFKTQRLLSDIPYLSDVKPGNAITSTRNRDGMKRFNFKATIVLEEFQ